MLRRTFLMAFAFWIVNISVVGQNKVKPSEENVVVQMNYCINALTNIVHNKSMSVLEHESDQLVNNLTMQQIIGLPEIRDFRIDLMDAVGKFEITEEERNQMRRIQSIKRDNIKWAAISNALNPTMLLTGNGGGFGPQMAFQALLTVARTAVEYKTMQSEQNIEELQAMWELRKEDMQTINELRKSAQGIVFDLYNKYHLSESDRLTESTANLFSDYISIADASRRVRLFQDNYETYKKIPEYYYHLGMAYLDKGDYSKAKVQFSTYLDLYKRTPILRYDERSGCIALAMLTYEKTLSATQKEELLSVALKNLPGNSAAILQCAMVYIYELNQAEKGFQIIRAGIDDPNATDRDVLFMAAANLMPYSVKFPTVYRSICETFKKTSVVSFDSYITYLIYTQNNAWGQIGNVASFSDCYSRTWFTLWLGKSFNDNFHLILTDKISCSPNDVCIYLEEHSDDELSIFQLISEDCYSFTEEEINDVDCFKANKNLKYLYVESIGQGVYKLKANIDIDKIKDETWPRQSEFTLSSSDIEDIVEFCEDHKAPTKTELEFKKNNSNKTSISEKNGFAITFYGDTLKYKAFHSPKQDGYYVRFVLSNGLQILYKYDSTSSTIVPYLYTDGKKTTYASNDAKIEYTYRERPQEETSWFSGLWTSISNWFSSDKTEKSANEQKKEDINESSWWDRIVSWFSSDDNTTSDNDKPKDGSSDSSWWNNAWGNISGWFFSDDNESTTESNESEDNKNDSDNEQSWWDKTWSAISGIF